MTAASVSTVYAAADAYEIKLLNVGSAQTFQQPIEGPCSDATTPAVLS